MKVGLPRAMHFYTYGVLWYTFLERLGVQVVLSDLTNREILDQGAKKMVDSACLPLKIMRGHAENLKDKEVDYIFLPRVVKPDQDTFTCPKSAGLPELIFQTGRELPPLLSPVIEGSIADPKPYYETGRRLGAGKNQTQKAFFQALRRWEAQQRQKAQFSCLLTNKAIAIIGHPYLTEDPFVNFHLKTRLSEKGYQTISSDQLRRLPENSPIYPKFMFWQSGHDMGAIAASAKRLAGCILLTAFGCGPDSYIETYCREHLDQQKIPHLTLTLDEQTGEAGFMTRVEAFLDVLERRERRQGA